MSAALIKAFQPERVLQVDTQAKSVVVLGAISGESAVLRLEKTPFGSDPAVHQLIATVQELNSNDVYFWSVAELVQDLGPNAGAKISLIYPATEQHIAKYKPQTVRMVCETPQDYEEVVAPYIATQRGARTQWVDNILHHGKEAETVVARDNDETRGYVLLPDMKWDQRLVELLYLVAIAMRADVASVRDLRGSHAPWLRSMLQLVRAAVAERYGVLPAQLRLFFHYQPLYYHLHVHVVNVAHPGLGDGVSAGRAILLDDVVANVELDPDYYKKRTLFYQLGSGHALYDALTARNDLKESC